MTPPATKYARSGNVRIAYQVVGDGPFDPVFVPGFARRYNVDRLVWFEVHDSPAAALQRSSATTRTGLISTPA